MHLLSYFYYYCLIDKLKINSRNFLLLIKLFLLKIILFITILTTISIFELKGEINNKELLFKKSFKQEIIKGARISLYYKKMILLTFNFLGEISNSEKLHTPLAHIGSNELLIIEARKGIYDKDSMILYLEDQVNILSSAGYHFLTEFVQFDTKNGEALGKSPVAGYSPLGAVKSDGLRILDRGRAVVLTGRSRLLFYPPPARITSN